MASLPDFQYRRPKTLEEAVSILSQYGEQAVILAGGIDLVPRMKMGLVQPKVIVSLLAIQGLTYIRHEAETIKIGALTTIHEVQHNLTIRHSFPALYEAAMSTASENIRLRGTIGGNIMQDTRCMYYNQPAQWRASFRPCFKSGGDLCNAAPGSKRCFAAYCGDIAPALMSLGSSVCLLSTDGERTIPLESIFTGDGRSPLSLRHGEVLREVMVPTSETMGGYEKLRIRSSIDYPHVSVALSSHRTKKGRLVVGAVGSQPFPYEFSSYTELGGLTEKACDDTRPMSNLPLSPLYRKNMVKVLTQKLLGRIEIENR